MTVTMSPPERQPRRPRRHAGTSKLRVTALSWLAALVLVGVWQLVTAAVGHPYFPTPAMIADTAWHIWFSGADAWTTDILPSVGRLLTGWLLAALVGIPAGLALGRSLTATAYASLVLFLARATPATLLLPVFLLIFGIGSTVETAIILWGSIWPILLNTIDGARAVNDVQTDTARAFRISRPQWIMLVVVPAAGPRIVNGLRMSLGLAMILMVVSEMVGTGSGIGFRLTQAQNQFATVEMWAWIVMISILGYVLNTLLRLVEARVLAWHIGYTGQADR
nr:ABC transporter permease [Kibdelosporangium sp. MJ126-NF4]CEL18253.1 Alkanesulfonates transport system permease protein [Kibdelosporangium sp. MJ126-NF4]CTQ90354.1 Alkanesulfonates transport system permease protein [Kibdelosporangium sp. MJ126-NF4]